VGGRDGDDGRRLVRLKEAKLHTRARNRPRLYVSAFAPHAADVAARYGDGLWTLGDPEQAPEIIDAYREARSRAGRDAGEIILHAGFHLAADEQAAIASARKWKATQLPEVYTEDIHDPAEMVRMADERMTDEEFAHEGFLVGADAGEHVERLREMLGLGATVICLQGIGDADPLGSIRRYGEEVLPALRAARA
jgi:coenzyme F420-dependent glucose-6-phosphate dehydrogenase